MSGRSGQAGLVLLLVGFLALTLGPFGLGALRLAGVSLAWWYAGVAAPLAAALITLTAFRPRR